MPPTFGKHLYVAVLYLQIQVTASVKTVTASYKRWLQGLFAQYVWDFYVLFLSVYSAVYIVCGNYIIVVKMLNSVSY